MSDKDLSLCPFCGNRAAIFYNNAYDKHFVECDSCLARGPAADSDELAGGAWNRRVTGTSK